MKKRTILFAVAMSVMIIAFAACSSGKTEKLIVASETRTCYGVGKQQCMLVKSEKSEPWTFFYGNIVGFDYESGYEYVLNVRKEEVKNPPQDASSLKYTLVKVVSKERRTSENMPPNIGD